MATRVSEELLTRIREHGRGEYPNECCGALLGTVEGDDKRVADLRPLTNVHEEGHARRYLISPAEMLGLEREARAAGQKVLGFYHSHPDHPARPSDYDRDWAWPWYSYIILAVERAEPRGMTCWTLDEDRRAFSRDELVPA